ncbi:helix-turn-helix domain-containing protein [Lacihabitans soyangensis]|uniref:AraC family transcriptional regulator n=1 Tax=Lacihabitans soyangensis TaxID=869394 RepID=A0AAE3H2Q5_9BACT|nr:AraC family transcriptional regulator [Lacihabitans soyangensis]MCP9763220.1 AraC family transcriptional regulator [Lacihabitans soyangensis]
MSIYTTPLQFAYFLGLLFSVLLLNRGFKEERLSDKLLAAVLFLLTMEIQDYTFGFSGINMLWEELNGFPRHFSLAFPPTVYFYLNAQINRDFKFKRTDFLYYIPYAIYFIINLFVFCQGKEYVDKWQGNPNLNWLNWLETITLWVLYFYFFILSLKIYKNYRKWAETQFSDTETISFEWIRNFIYLIITGEVFKTGWNLADYIIDMPFEKDWWWHLYTVAIICYVGISGYAQTQPKTLHFEAEIMPEIKIEESTKKISEELIPKIKHIFSTEKVFLEPELTLSELALKLKTNTSLLSAAINQGFGKNFNDFVNEYRIREFEKQLSNPENKNYTKLAIALDCGFNSKATFNRALKKFS